MNAIKYIFIIIITLILALKYSDEIKYFAFHEPVNNQIPSLGEQIQKGRKSKNMTPETLASTIGLSIDQLKSIENNKATPTRDLLAEMEAKLDTEFIIY